jgi:hypothetical protein
MSEVRLPTNEAEQLRHVVAELMMQLERETDEVSREELAAALQRYRRLVDQIRPQ